jgi:ABC transporter substrate binding protein
MRRREFITLVSGATAARAWASAARAQSQKLLRTGMVSVLPRNTPFMDAFVKRLRALGYEEGQNLAIEYLKISSPAEYAEGMKELVSRHVDIIVAQGPEVTLKSAMAVTDTLPIVMVAIDYDPFARGYVTSFAHPTGNVTGIFFQQIELTAKRLEISERTRAGFAVRSSVLRCRFSGSVSVLKELRSKSWDKSFRRGNARSSVQLRSCLGKSAGRFPWHVDPSDFRGVLSGSPADR